MEFDSEGKEYRVPINDNSSETIKHHNEFETQNEIDKTSSVNSRESIKPNSPTKLTLTNQESIGKNANALKLIGEESQINVNQTSESEKHDGDQESVRS